MPAFHRAVLSAHQVRCDFAIFLIDVWNAVWKPMLEQSDFGTNTEPCSVAESQRRFGQNVDTMEVWKTTWFGRAFTSADFYFVLGICSDAKCVQLSISFYDADEADRTTQIDPGDSWPRRDIADGVAYSSTRLAPIRDDGSSTLARFARRVTMRLSQSRHICRLDRAPGSSTEGCVRLRRGRTRCEPYQFRGLDFRERGRLARLNDRGPAAHCGRDARAPGTPVSPFGPP